MNFIDSSYGIALCVRDHNDFPSKLKYIALYNHNNIFIHILICNKKDMRHVSINNL